MLLLRGIVARDRAVGARAGSGLAKVARESSTHAVLDFDWFGPWRQVLDDSREPFHRRFAGEMLLNTARKQSENRTDTENTRNQVRDLHPSGTRIAYNL